MVAPPSGKERLRREKVRILLRTRNDAYPSPRARAIPSTPAGPAPGRAKKCPACSGTGKVRVWQVCAACEGRGRISVDGYTGRVSDSGTRHVQGMAPERMDAEISRLETSLKLSAGKIDPEESYGWEKARASQNAAGSYRELAKVLEWLRGKHPIGWDFLLWAYGPLHPELSDNHRRLEEFLVTAVAAQMPREIKVPKREWEVLQEKRRSRVKQLAKEATVEEIALEVGLAPKTVTQMLADMLRV
jgi:hypothetical protein